MTENKQITKPLINTPNYNGPDRRSTMQPLCGYHFQHVQILNAHDTKIKDLEINHKDDIKDVEQKMSDRSKDLWDDMKTKASNKLLYTFIIGYTAFFVLGIATVYTGMHKFDKNISKELSILKEEVSKSNVHLLYQKQLTSDLKEEIKNINKKIDHINQQKGNNQQK